MYGMLQIIKIIMSSGIGTGPSPSQGVCVRVCTVYSVQCLLFCFFELFEFKLLWVFPRQDKKIIGMLQKFLYAGMLHYFLSNNRSTQPFLFSHYSGRFENQRSPRNFTVAMSNISRGCLAQIFNEGFPHTRLVMQVPPQLVKQVSWVFYINHFDDGSTIVFTGIEHKGNEQWRPLQAYRYWWRNYNNCDLCFSSGTHDGW